MAVVVADEKRMPAGVITQFDSLYEDVLLKIFSYFDRASLISVAQTCKAMKVTSYHPSLWKDYMIAYRAIGELSEESATSFRKRQISSVTVQTRVSQLCVHQPCVCPSPGPDVVVHVCRCDCSWHAWIVRKKMENHWVDNMKCLASAAQVKSIKIIDYLPFAMFPVKLDSLKHVEFTYYASPLGDHVHGTRHSEPFVDTFNNMRHLTSLCINISPRRERRFRIINYRLDFRSNSYMHCLDTILKSLPCLEDLSFSEDDCFTNKQISPNITYPVLKSLSVQGHMNWFELVNLRLPEAFPNLKHLEIGWKYNTYSRDDDNSEKTISLLSKLSGLDSLVTNFLSYRCKSDWEK